MKLEDLDTLLRNKLQLVSSETTPDELEGIMVGLGAGKPKKKPKALIWFLGAGMLALFAGASIYYITNNSNNRDVAKIKENTAIETPKTKIENISNNKLENNVPQQTTSLKTSKTKIKAVEKRILNPTLNKTNRNSYTLDSEGPIIEKTISLKETNLSKQSSQARLKSLGINSIPKSLKPKIFHQKTATLALSNLLIVPEYDEKLGKAKMNFVKYVNPTVSVWMTAQNNRETVEVNEPNKVHKNYLNQYNTGLRNNWTFNTGAKMQFNLLRYFKIGTGIGYLNTGSAYDYDFKINNIPVEDAATGNILGYITKPDSSSSSVVKSGKHSASYIEIPLSFSANILLTQKIRIGIEASLINQWLLNEKGESLNTTSLKLNSNATFKPKIMSYELGLPLTFNRNKRTSITLTPYLGRSKNTVSQQNNINKNRNFSGLRLSLNYNLIQL